MSKPDPRNENPWKAAGLVGALGANLAICVVAGYYAGSFISERAGGHKGWLIAGVLAGLIAGIANIVLLIKHFLEDTNE